MPGVELVALFARQPSQRRAHVLAHGNALTPEQALESRLPGEALDEGPQLGEARRAVRRRIADDRCYLARERRGERRHCADRSGAQTLMDQRFGPDEDVEIR